MKGLLVLIGLSLLVSLVSAQSNCHRCWQNKMGTGCGAHFVQDCMNGSAFAYSKKTSATKWLTYCWDGTYFTMDPSLCTHTVNGVSNLCRIACTSVNGQKRDEDEGALLETRDTEAVDSLWNKGSNFFGWSWVLGNREVNDIVKLANWANGLYLSIPYEFLTFVYTITPIINSKDLFEMTLQPMFPASKILYIGYNEATTVNPSEVDFQPLASPRFVQNLTLQRTDNYFGGVPLGQTLNKVLQTVNVVKMTFTFMAEQTENTKLGDSGSPWTSQAKLKKCEYYPDSDFRAFTTGLNCIGGETNCIFVVDAADPKCKSTKVIAPTTVISYT